MDKIIIYIDGACSGNPGPGGWAAILIWRSTEQVLSGGEKYTTNQRMELKAAVEALKRLKCPCKVELYSDSAYLINAFNQGWLEKWQKNGWKTAKKQAVENQDLWKELLTLSCRHDISWHKVKGHSGNAYNERCDKLARQEIERLKEERIAENMEHVVSSFERFGITGIQIGNRIIRRDLNTGKIIEDISRQ